MSNLFKETSSNRVRYNKYEWKEDNAGTLYITPTQLQDSIMDFVTCYGLLGFMTALPTTPDFITYHAVYLPTGNGSIWRYRANLSHRTA